MKFPIVIALALLSCEKPTSGAEQQKIALLQAHTVSTSEATLSVVSFDRRTAFFTVADKEGGPESSWQSAQAAAKAHDGIAAINGGFFGKEGKPLGLVVEDGKRLGGVTKNSLGAAFLIDNPPSLLKRTTFLSQKPKVTQALQSGPTLLWKGKVTGSLRNKKSRPRSFILWDGANHLALGHSTSLTLKELAGVLKSQPIPEFTITHAVNLDGGSSSDLWVSSKVKGGGFERRSWFNKPVRNYLILHSLP